MIERMGVPGFGHVRGRRCAAAPDSRELLLAAAGRVFARRGLTGGPMREISREAGLSVTMIYYHFKGKEGLACRLVDQAWSELLSGLDAWDADRKGLWSCAKFRRLGALLGRHLGRGSTLGALSQDPGLRRFERLRGRLDEGREEVVTVLRDLLAEGQRSGALKRGFDLAEPCRWMLSMAACRPFPGPAPKPLNDAMLLAGRPWDEQLWLAMADHPAGGVRTA